MTWCTWVDPPRAGKPCDPPLPSSSLSPPSPMHLAEMTGLPVSQTLSPWRGWGDLRAFLSLGSHDTGSVSDALPSVIHCQVCILLSCLGMLWHQIYLVKEGEKCLPAHFSTAGTLKNLLKFSQPHHRYQSLEKPSRTLLSLVKATWPEWNSKEDKTALFQKPLSLCPSPISDSIAQSSPGRGLFPSAGSCKDIYVCMRAKSLQSCLSLCNPMDCSLPSSSVHGILQARILEWVAISFSRSSSQHRDWNHVSCLLHWQEGSSPLAPIQRQARVTMRPQVSPRGCLTEALTGLSAQAVPPSLYPAEGRGEARIQEASSVPSMVPTAFCRFLHLFLTAPCMALC